MEQILNMKYAYEDLSDDQFERLVIFLCQRIHGIAVQGFAKGPDGGKDAKFIGTSENYPSQRSPWSGTVIIQAKHTNGFNKHFSESDFYSRNSKTNILAVEIIKIKKLIQNNKLTHYMLFSNRRLPSNVEDEIIEYISQECGLPISSIALFGIEQLEIWLKRFPDAAIDADLDPIDCPLIISPDDLSEVVYALHRQWGEKCEKTDIPPTPRIPYARKNKINNMSSQYADELIKKYLKETSQINNFLSDPINKELLGLYEAVVEEFQLKIIAKRKEFTLFDDIINYIADLLINRDPVLKKHKKITRSMLFYMYWNCDIGSEKDAETN